MLAVRVAKDDVGVQRASGTSWHVSPKGFDVYGTWSGSVGQEQSGRTETSTITRIPWLDGPCAQIDTEHFVAVTTQRRCNKLQQAIFSLQIPFLKTLRGHITGDQHMQHSVSCALFQVEIHTHRSHSPSRPLKVIKMVQNTTGSRTDLDPGGCEGSRCATNGQAARLGVVCT